MKIMLIDDDPDSLKGLKNALKLNGFHVVDYTQPEEAINQSPFIHFDALICDYHFPDMKAPQVVAEILRRKHDLPVIIISGDTDEYVETASLAAGAMAFLTKPIDIEKIIGLLNEI